MSAEAGTKTKQKKSKLEKIYELQAANKSLKEENRTLRKQLHAASSGASLASSKVDGPVTSTEAKLLEAMRALKRVTVKQEMALNTIRQKASERRRQVDDRDRKIRALQQEIKTLEDANKARQALSSDTDIGGLRNEVEDLQLKCAEQENRVKMLTLQLEASEDKARNLQKQLDSARNLMERAGSVRSLKSTDTAASEYDLARMRKELANKIERIVLLEFDLEMCRDELHELKQKYGVDDAFPSRVKSGNTSGSGHESFSDDDEDDEDDMW
jgi:chromosome segregation ATPase